MLTDNTDKGVSHWYLYAPGTKEAGLAEQVDRVRGYYSDAPEGQPTGNDTAETLFQLACRLSLEIHEPSTGRE